MEPSQSIVFDRSVEIKQPDGTCYPLRYSSNFARTGKNQYGTLQIIAQRADSNVPGLSLPTDREEHQI
ncbi:MAG: hypothetical protein HY832_02700, partial [Candidatus Aenigmarchaeota archaeon]|nr:hypothetical protein [Candidatus Aenigmarchaeota archaeon]